MRANVLFCLLACCGVLLSGFSAESFAQEFRVESWVYRGNEKEATSESLTLFKAGVVYDFTMPEAERVTIFDYAHGRFVLLDHGRRVKTTITTEELLVFERDLRDQPEFTKQSYLIDPQFKEEYDPKEQLLTMASDNVTYRAKTQKADSPEIAKAFRNFADYYARFNAYSGNVHSLARIKLNQSLAQRGMIPQEVKLAIAFKGLVGTKLDLRSRHLFNKLSENDIGRIDKAGVGLTSYSAISLPDFRKADKMAAKGK